MSNTPAKKFLVIPSDMYNRPTKHTAKSYQPEKSELIKSEEGMQNVWDSSAHQKVKLSTEELNKFKSLLKTMPLKVQIQQQDAQQTPSINSNNEISMKENYENDETTIQGLAEANQKKGIALVDFLKMHPDWIMWNGKGEMITKERLFMDQI